MPSVYFENLPINKLDENALVTLHQELKTAIGRNATVIIRDTFHHKITTAGKVIVTNKIRAFVDLYNRPYWMKALIAEAIEKFANAHGQNSFVSFSDKAKGSFFSEGKLLGNPPKTFNLGRFAAFFVIFFIATLLISYAVGEGQINARELIISAGVGLVVGLLGEIKT